jgi:hypothetical protein
MARLLLSMQSRALRPALPDDQRELLSRDRWRGISFKLREQRSYVRELTEWHRPLCGSSGQQTTRRRNVGLRFSFEQQQRDLSGRWERNAGQLAGQAPHCQKVALGKCPL